MKPRTSQNGVRNLPRPCTVTPTMVAVASAVSGIRRPTTFDPISIPTVQAVRTMPNPMFSTPRTSST